jgi:hypothetical protein
VTLLLLTMWALCFAAGAYEIYTAWTEHQGPHGHDSVHPLGLPDLSRAVQQKINLGT